MDALHNYLVFICTLERAKVLIFFDICKFFAINPSYTFVLLSKHTFSSLLIFFLTTERFFSFPPIRSSVNLTALSLLRKISLLDGVGLPLASPDMLYKERTPETYLRGSFLLRLYNQLSFIQGCLCIRLCG